MATILVVDDSAICRELIAAALQTHGYSTVSARSGAEALAVMKREPPDLMLLDISMPEMDGFAVLDAVRRKPEWKEIPVILLTDRTERRYILQAGSRGAQGYFLKSNFSLDQLLGRVQACLEKTSTAAAGSAVRGAQASGSSGRGANAAAVAVVSKREPSPRPSTNVREEPEAAMGKRSSSVQHGSTRLTHAPPSEPPQELAPVITKANLVKLVNEGLELRPLGLTVHNVMAATGNPKCSAEEVFKAVAPDQALSIRLLKLANSAAYSRGRPVESVKEAVQRIGTQGVRNLATTLDVLAKYDGAASAFLDPRLFWEHSIACGVIASSIAKARKCKEVDEYFLWGLVHDVGRLILLEHVPEQYARAWEAGKAAALPFEMVEAKMMLLDHCDILARALEHWKFPRDFIVPAVSHHQSIHGIKRLGPKHAEAAATIALANRMAHALLIGRSGNDVVYPLDEFVEFLHLPPETVAGVAEAARDETNDLKFTMLARANEDTWPDYRGSVQDQLAAPFEPLCVSAQAEVDAYRVFCRQLVGESDERTPNVAVVYLRDAREQAAMGTKLQAEEKKIGATALPVIAICSKGTADAQIGWGPSRKTIVLKPPVRISNFMQAVNELLSN